MGQEELCYKYLGSEEELGAALEENEYVLVVYSATWCGPCKALKEWLGVEHKTFPCPILIVDVEEHEALAEDVRALPTLVGYCNKEVFVRAEGFDKSKVKALLDDVILRRNKKED